MSEDPIIQRAGQGDQAAWEQLMREHRQAVFRLAYLLLGDADEAEDAAQETFILAFRSILQFDSTRPLRPWLLGITRNVAFNRQRAAKRYIHALKRLIWVHPEIEKPGNAPGGLHEDAQALWQAVRRLDRADQDIIYLRYFLELSVSETAETLDIAPGTVKSRLHRAVERLRNVMTAEFAESWERRQS